MLRSLPLLLLHSALSSKPTPSRLLSSAAAATTTGRTVARGGGAHGTVSAVLEIVGPIELLFPSSEARLYVRLLRRCALDSLAAGAGAVHGHVLKRGFAPDTLVSNVLMDTYAKGGSLAACRLLFDEMAHRDVASWCTVISANVSRGLWVEAIGLFKGLLSSEVKPNRFVVSSVLNACARSGVLELGLMVHGLVIKSGLGVDRFVEVGFVDMYAKCGNVGCSRRFFDEIPVKSSVAWNAAISGFIENGCVMEAAELCRDMHTVGIAMDVVSLRLAARVAAAVGMFELCRSIHVYALKVGLGRDCFVVSELVKSAGRVGETQYIGELVAAVRRRDASLYALAIAGYHSNGRQVEAVNLAEHLLSSGLSLREGDMVTVLDVCHVKEEVQQVHAYTLKSGSFSYINVCNALISVYSELGSLMHAEAVFKTAHSRDVVSWASVMAGCVKNLQFEKAFGYCEGLRNSGLLLDQHCIATIINICTGLQDMDKGQQIHALALKVGLLVVDFISASLVNMYAKCHHMECAAELFSQALFPRDLVVTNAMLSGYCWNFLPEKALLLFCSEYHSGLCPDHFTCSTVLRACADIGAKEAGEQIHGYLIKTGSEYMDVIVGNAVIDLYVKCGHIASACRFFHSMRSWSMNSYAMLMLGYIQNRCNDEALQLFSKMQHSGLRANRVTFARILRGCADLCAIDLGRQLHASIIKMGLISDVYVANALVGMYKRSDSLTDPIREPREILSGNDSELNTDNCYSEQRDGSSNLEEIGLFTLEEEKDHETSDHAQKISISAASQFYETSVPIHVLGQKLRINTISGNLRNDKCSKSKVFLDTGYQGNRGGSLKLFNLLQVDSTGPDQFVLVVFIDNSLLNIKDTRFVNVELMGRSGAVPTLRFPP